MRHHGHDITPSASRLTKSLRDIGYDFTAAIADLVDNSVSAGATTVEIDLEYRGEESWVLVADDGHGMTDREITEALRFGTRRDYPDGDLGRFGLGLKTAALSQARRVSVVSRHAPVFRRIVRRCLDLDHIEAADAWNVRDPSSDIESMTAAGHRLRDAPGTVVVLEKLDRVFNGVAPVGGWARRRFEKLAADLNSYLGMVFHRFLEGSVDPQRRFRISVNGSDVRPWNPFAPDEPGTRELAPRRYALPDGNSGSCSVILRRYILPPRSDFSSPEAFERLGGIRRWNRQQGLYVYRGSRLVQAGTWAGLRGIDEHMKLARAALDFPTALDEAFMINVAKMRVQLPPSLREMLAKPVNELCMLADARYRAAGAPRRLDGPKRLNGTNGTNGTELRSVGTALRTAAALADESETLERIARALRTVDENIARRLGF